MADYDPALIANLEALNYRTIRYWMHPQNAPRFVKAALGKTPSTPDREPTIQLSFNNMPRNPSQGFVCGFDKKECDIHCGQISPEYTTCKRAFCINVNARGEVVLFALTDKVSTVVKYGDQHAGQRGIFQWILYVTSSVLHL